MNFADTGIREVCQSIPPRAWLLSPEVKLVYVANIKDKEQDFESSPYLAPPPELPSTSRAQFTSGHQGL